MKYRVIFNGDPKNYEEFSTLEEAKYFSNEYLGEVAIIYNNNGGKRLMKSGKLKLYYLPYKWGFNVKSNHNDLLVLASSKEDAIDRATFGMNEFVKSRVRVIKHRIKDIEILLDESMTYSIDVTVVPIYHRNSENSKYYYDENHKLEYDIDHTILVSESKESKDALLNLFKNNFSLLNDLRN